MIHALVTHLWQSTLFPVVAGLLTLALRKNGAHTRYWIWFAASCKFLIPFSILAALGSHLHLGWQASAPARFSPMVEEFTRPFYPVASAAAPPLAPLATPHSAFNPLFILAAIWAFGVLAVGVYWLVRWRRIQSAVKNSQPLAVDSPVPVRSSSSSIEPGVVGLFRPVVLLPEGIEERLSPEQFQAIMTHELCHVRRRDNLTAAIHMLVEALFWFHPLVWWLGRQLLAERERACDEAVIAAGGNSQVYAEGILAVCKHYLESPLVCAAGVAGADLKKRIERIMSGSVSRRLNAARKALLVTAAATAIVMPILSGSILSTSLLARAAFDDSKAPSFQTVTIRQSQPGTQTRMILVQPDGFKTQGFSLRDVITFAYDTQRPLVSGPETLDALYDINAGTSKALPFATGYPLLDAVRPMVRKMLADRFSFQAHFATETRPVYVLTVSESGLRMKEATPGTGPWISVNLTAIGGRGMRMDYVIEELSARLGRPVMDQTGLTKIYDYDLDWKDHATAAAAAGKPLSETDPKPDPDVIVAALKAQLGLVAHLEQKEMQVLMVDRALPPSDLVPALAAVPIDPKLFDTYVGHYQVPGGSVMTVSREDTRFYTQMLGQPRVEIFPKGPTEFFANIVNAQITFEPGAEGSSTGLVLHQMGHDLPMPRMNEAEAIAAIDAIQTKIKENRPTPGSEKAVEESIRNLAAGKPNYDRMSPQLAEVARQQLPHLQRDTASLGKLASLKFTGVDPMGWDTYLAQFEHGSLECHINMAPDGKISGELLRPGH